MRRFNIFSSTNSHGIDTNSTHSQAETSRNQTDAQNTTTPGNILNRAPGSVHATPETLDRLPRRNAIYRLHDARSTPHLQDNLQEQTSTTNNPAQNNQQQDNDNALRRTLALSIDDHSRPVNINGYRSEDDAVAEAVRASQNAAQNNHAGYQNPSTPLHNPNRVSGGVPVGNIQNQASTLRRIRNNHFMHQAASMSNLQGSPNSHNSTTINPVQNDHSQDNLDTELQRALIISQTEISRAAGINGAMDEEAAIREAEKSSLITRFIELINTPKNWNNAIGDLAPELISKSGALGCGIRIHEDGNYPKDFPFGDSTQLIQIKRSNNSHYDVVLGATENGELLTINVADDGDCLWRAALAAKDELDPTELSHDNIADLRKNVGDYIRQTWSNDESHMELLTGLFHGMELDSQTQAEFLKNDEEAARNLQEQLNNEGSSDSQALTTDRASPPELPLQELQERTALLRNENESLRAELAALINSAFK